MKTIALISCSAMKAGAPCPARDLYISPLFKLSNKYSEQFKPDAKYILSVQHGLVKYDQVLAPYNGSMLKSGKANREAWTKKVLAQLAEVGDLQNDKFIFFTGQDYYAGLLPHLKHYEMPLQGLGIGPRIAFLKKKVAEA